jgi:hypothetical protein
MLIRFRRLVLAVLVLAILLLGSIGVAAYTELITNGTFDADVTGWVTTSGAIAHQTGIVHSGAGAATISNTNSGIGNTTGGVEQAIESITGGNYYGAQAYAYIPEGSGATSTLIRLAWYATSDCSGSQLSTVDSGEQSTKDQWNYIKVYAQAPATAQCYKVRLLVRKSGAAAQFAHFDDASAFQTNANAVSLRSLNAGAGPSGALWAVLIGLLPIAGLAAWRRMPHTSKARPTRSGDDEEPSPAAEMVYEAPTVTHEAALEVRAGSPLSIGLAHEDLFQ